jgi:uncharacterized coiled-coil protein SlyX
MDALKVRLDHAEKTIVTLQEDVSTVKETSAVNSTKLDVLSEDLKDVAKSIEELKDVISQGKGALWALGGFFALGVAVLEYLHSK